ncbi:MAG TPA: diguanylate cyclase [Paenisporosarcina sp.]|nr:diguanylate cyclase [Paenisporosarcina sp.]
MERYFSKSFHEMSWNGPVIFMHWTMDVNTQPVEYITPNIQRILGYTPDELLSGQVPLLSAIFEEDRDKFLDTMNQRIASKSPFWESSYRIYSKKGDIRFIKSYTYIKQENSSDITSIFSYLFDQTEIKQEINMHISLEHRWATAIDSAREGVWDWDMKHNKVFFSKHWKGMLGFKEHEVPNELNEWRKRIHPQDVGDVDSIIEGHIHNESNFFESEHRLLHADGTYRWILDRGKAVERNKQGIAVRMIGTHVDITERKATEKMLQDRNEELERLVEQVKLLSITDPLTALYNRRKMIEEIKCAQHQLNVNEKTFTLAILDLDHFKKINDQYGHTFGDIALQTFANLLKRQITSPNIIARWGGEEFILLFPSHNAQETKRQLDALQEACNNDQLLRYCMNSVHLSFSAGIYEVRNHQVLEEIIKCADLALYKAKSLGRKQIIVYKEGLSVV